MTTSTFAEGSQFILRPVRHLSIIALAAALMAMANPISAQAQEQSTQSADASATIDAEATDETEAASEAEADKPAHATLDEVIVTAQRRAENVQDVPISISAVGAETLRKKGITDMHNLATQTPNVDITPGSAGNIIRIRGLGSLANDGFEQSVGFYVDDIYYGRNSYISAGFLDLQRVEVLRGPQGTLFGKNTVAGAVNVHTRNPSTSEWEAEGDVKYGDKGQKQYTIAVGAPIIEDLLGIRVAGTMEERDGYVENTTRGLYEAKVDKINTRGKIRLTPNEHMRFTLGGAYNKEKDTGPGFELTQASDVSLLLSRTANPSTEAVANWEGATDADAIVARNTVTATLHGEIDLGEHTVYLISGWSRFKEHADIDADGIALPLLQWNNFDAYEQISAEARLVSPAGDLEYVAGIHYFYNNYEATTDFRIGNFDQGTALLLGIALPPAAESALGDLLLGILDGGLGLNDLLGQTLSDRLDQYFEQSSESWAAFGQVTWRPWDRFALVLGLRASYETKDAFLSQAYENTGLLLRAGLGIEEYQTTVDRSEFHITPKISVKYDVTEGMMAFITIAQGFKAGGFNPFAENPANVPFDEESSITYEMGFKGEFLENRLRANLTGFYTEFDDLQVSIVGGTGSTFIVGNAAAATTQGIELDTEWLVFEGLTVVAAVGWTDATFDSFPNSPCMASPTGALEDPNSCDASGRALTETPEWNVSAGFNWFLPLDIVFGDGLPVAFMIGGELLYNSDTFLNLDYDPASHRESFTRYDARVGLVDLDGRWAFIVNGTNLTNEKVNYLSVDAPLQAGTHIGILQPPRYISGTFQITF